MIKYVHEMAQFVSDQVRKRVKNLRDLTIVEILDNLVDLLTLGIGKTRGLRELREDVKAEDEDLRDYVTKVISKLDKIAVTL